MDENRQNEVYVAPLSKAASVRWRPLRLSPSRPHKAMAAETKLAESVVQYEDVGKKEAPTAMIAFNSFRARQQVPWEPAKLSKARSVHMATALHLRPSHGE
mgnify:CR=1 FL=1